MKKTVNKFKKENMTMKKVLVRIPEDQYEEFKECSDYLANKIGMRDVLKMTDFIRLTCEMAVFSMKKDKELAVAEIKALEEENARRVAEEQELEKAGTVD